MTGSAHESPGLARTVFRLLTFRLTRDEFARLDSNHLYFGLTATWIVGIGRWWDDPDASLLQHLGLGSIIYVFALAFILWLIIKPLRPKEWSYRHVLTVVTLTSPPAILYAIPVERFTSMATARDLNVLFLALVASWRVALLAFYLRRHARLSGVRTVVSVLLPVTLIITTLTFLNLERAVFDVMGGFRDGTANDSAYFILILLTFGSMFTFLPLLVAYFVLALEPRDD